ncbi:MAG: response regulator [Lachnospiraceae bacterium]|nr:response regulator [Lachnospiraceae bacterium]MBR4755103.1 response regulator [Lachnospiraceae bacterium]MBR4806963.1 response regulator [Lachnospiraceae bacterium]
MLLFVIEEEVSILGDMEKAILGAGGDKDTEIAKFSRCKEALDAIEKGQIPDVVFTDTEMPDMSGLDFALRLKGVAPDTRTIFVSEDERYAVEAFRIKAYGYLIKPLKAEDVRCELESIPEFRKEDRKKLEIRCFGHFDIFWQGKPLIFARKQSKELLAYLVDREGAACTSGEIATALWKEGEDTASEKNRIRVLVNDLRTTLRKIGMEDVIIRDHRELAIRRELVDCDYYSMLEGDRNALKAYRGKYMEDYSWAELTNANLYFKKKPEDG